jgi:plastocyanin
MKDGPVSGVPITIKVFNNAVIGFWIGPDKVSNHFGTGPVFGTLSANTRAMVKEMHSLMQGMNGKNVQGSMNNASQNNSMPNATTVKMSAKEVGEVYRWSTDAGINPTLKMIANINNTIQIQNPTDEKHELVIESNGTELASSGDILAGKSGQLNFNANMTGTFEYHCEYHPDTMKGILQVTNS